MVKNLPANAGAVGLIPESGRFHGGGNGNRVSNILAWKIPLTEEPGSYTPWGHKGLDMTEHTHIKNIKKDTNKQMRRYMRSGRILRHGNFCPHGIGDVPPHGTWIC